MQLSTLTLKGQTTVPLSIRQALQVDAGAQLNWHLLPNGAVMVRAKNKSILDMAGSLKGTRKVSTKNMNAWN